MSSQQQGITQELGIGEVISKTFQLYRRDFAKYVVLFLVVETVIGVLNVLVQRAIVLPALPRSATPQQFASSAAAYFGAVFELIALTAVVTWVFYPIAYGSAVKMASDVVEKGSADLEASVRLAVSKLLWIWAVGIVVGIIVILGFIALIVPGIILSIMFSLVLPAIIIEGLGFGSMSRSRKLVSHRWLKTFGLFLVFGIIIVIASIIVSTFTAHFGVVGSIVSSVVSALYLPLIPIMLVVYYYSNVARIAPPPISPPPPPPQMAPNAMVVAGMKYCPNCGSRLDSVVSYCPSCGSKQPV